MVDFIMNLQSKVCTTCGIDKPVTEFGIRSDRASGRRSECKLCARNRNFNSHILNKYRGP